MHPVALLDLLVLLIGLETLGHARAVHVLIVS